MDQRVPRGSVGGLELHGQSPQAALGGPLKSFTILQQRPVQMKAYICLETLWEAFQHLGRRRSDKAGKGRGEEEQGLYSQPRPASLMELLTYRIFATIRWRLSYRCTGLEEGRGKAHRRASLKQARLAVFSRTSSSGSETNK